MKKNPFSAKFIAFDGPNGAGKSTLIREVQKELNKLEFDVLYTCEPSGSEIGNFTRRFSEECSGNSLACLVAADRYSHLEKTIYPALTNGTPVITDRYVLSSYILQKMDGVESDFITAINQDIILPDLQVVIVTNENTLKERLSERCQLTRFERNNRSRIELENTQIGVDILKRLGVLCLIIDNDKELAYNSRVITEEIIKLIR